MEWMSRASFFWYARLAGDGFREGRETVGRLKDNGEIVVKARNAMAEYSRRRGVRPAREDTAYRDIN